MLTYWNWKGKQVSGSELREVTIRTAKKIFFSAFLRCFSKDIGNVCKRGQGDDRAHRGWVTLWRWTRNANFSSRGLPDQFTKWIERYAVVEELDHHVVRHVVRTHVWIFETGEKARKKQDCRPNGTFRGVCSRSRNESRSDPSKSPDKARKWRRSSGRLPKNANISGILQTVQ